MGGLKKTILFVFREIYSNLILLIMPAFNFNAKIKVENNNN